MRKINILHYSISASLIIVALSVAYYFVIYVPKQNDLKIKRDEARIEQEKKDNEKEKQDKELEYTRCKLSAIKSNSDWWNDECKAKGLKDDCLLPQYNADRLTADLNKEKDRCLQMYKTN